MLFELSSMDTLTKESDNPFSSYKQILFLLLFGDVEKNSFSRNIFLNTILRARKCICRSETSKADLSLPFENDHVERYTL
jgi:hypothetical protein